MNYDFSGWATRNDLKCSDGRVIRKNAFIKNDGMTVPLVWNHQHNDPSNVLGHALLENREEGVYAYGFFNDTESGEIAKALVKHKDICALSIFANNLKQKGPDVIHGQIREVSLVHAGENPGAFIDSMINHGEESDEEAIIYTGLELEHSDKSSSKSEKKVEEPSEEKHEENNKEKEEMANDKKDDKTLKDVIDTMTEEQKTAMYALVGLALDEADEDEIDEEDEKVKHNIFDGELRGQDNLLTADGMNMILKSAKSNAVGSLQHAIDIYAENNNLDKDSLMHGFNNIKLLFPDYTDVTKGAPDLLTNDQGWVSVVMQKATKSPFSRIRTKQTDARNLRALGYKTGEKKTNGPNINLLNRTTDPQTVYRKDALNRDDIIDITDFDVVEYQYGIMKLNLNEEIAIAAMIGDGREEGDPDKIQPDKIRSIWHDDELYTIHADVDVTKMKAELQGTNTAANFGENYVYAEAIVQSSLYSREKYKGSGTPDFYCTPHLLNIMLLARDMNGRRIYSSKAELAQALNVENIYTAEQFEGKVRQTTDGKKKKLLGIFTNIKDYQFGATKGGEITRFNQFDIDFNQEKYLIETRLSGALTKVFSAICLEEDVSALG